MRSRHVRRLYAIVMAMMVILSPLTSLFPWKGIGSVAGENGENSLIPVSTITGPDEGDRFGWNVSWVGDVNGDGFDDIIAGAPYTDRYMGSDWWDTSWSYRRKLIFDNSGQSEDLVNFPILVNLSASNFDYLKAKLDGTDLRFIDEDGVTELNYDIEFWNSSGNSYIWVNVTRIDTGSSTDYIWMYYGNPVASDGQNKSGTYDANYVGVWHLNEIGEGNSNEFEDSSSYDNDGQGGSGTLDYVPTRIEGKIGGGQNFDGIDDHINCGYDTSIDIGVTQITLEAWINFAGYDPSHYIGIMSHGGWTEGYRLVIRHNGNPLYFHLPEDASWLGASQDTSTDSWVHVVGVYNGSRMMIYLNGIKDTNELSKTDNIETCSNEFWIGHGDNATGQSWSYPWNGSIDEVRVSNIARSADWIKAQYLSMNDTFIIFGGEETKAWWNTSWSYRKKLIFDNSGQSEDLVNFPVMVNLSSSNFDYSKAKSDGSDLRFIDDDGTKELNYEIESWDPSGNSYIWVNVTNIEANSNTDFMWLYYGNSNANDGSNPEGVWDSNYVGVWHLIETGDGTPDEYEDSTSYPNEGQGGGGNLTRVPTMITGKIDGSQDFDEVDDYIICGQDSSIANIFDNGGTISAWIYPEGFGGFNFGRILDKSSATAGDNGWVMCIDGTGSPSDHLLFYRGFSVNRGLWYTPQSSIILDQWQHVLVVYNESSDLNDPIIFINGIEQSITEDVGATPSGIASNDSVQSLYIGNFMDGGRTFNGAIDEIRISNIARSTDWVRAQYLSMNNSFITYDNEELKDWWNTSWLYRKKLIFDNSGQSEDLVNFPIMVNLSSSNFDYSKAKIDGTDLRFIDDDGITELNYEFESWNSSGNSYIWVNVTNILAGSTTDFIWMYYGNIGAVDGENPTGVWDNNYVMVHHLEESGISSRFDSTRYGSDGIPVNYDGDEAVSGMIGGADDFDGFNDFINFGNPVELQITGAMTLEVLFRADFVDNDFLLAKMGENGEMGWDLSLEDWPPIAPDGYAEFRYSTNGSNLNSVGWECINASEWHYLVGEFNPSTYERFFLNGRMTYENSISIPPACFDPPVNVYLAHAVRSSAIYFDGIIDEVRVSNVARSTDWIRAQYLSLNNSFISYGGEESLSEDCGAAYIFFGYPGIILNNIDAANANVTIYGSNAGDLFGWSLSDAGDVNNDGYDDIIIGAPGWGAERGRAYIFHGRATSSWKSVYDADTEADMILTGENEGDRFGFSVSGAGDVNNDGLFGDFYEGWLYRKKIIINSSQVAADLTDFPMLISFIDSDLKSRARPDGFDILFTEPDGKAKLDHEIERYDNISGELVAWVKVPFLSSTTDTIIYMYYGNPDASDQSNPTGVWSNGYRGVWHLSEISGNALDSTFYGTSGTILGTVTQGDLGKIDRAYTLEPNGNDNVDMGDPVDGHLDFGTGSFTVSVWVKDHPYTNYNNIVYKGSRSSSNPDGYSFYHRSNDGEACWSIGDNLTRVQNDYDYSQDGTWRYLVGVADRSAQISRIYVNGIEQGAGVDINSIGSVDTDSSFAIPGNDYLNATVDEVRVFSGACTAEWIETEFNNQNNTSTFYFIGEEEIIPQNWLYRKPITINASQVIGDLTNFPMLFNVLDTDLKNKAHTDGYDIVFTRPDGRIRLDHEIESYDSSSGELIAWIKIPYLYSSTDTMIYMYYGNSLACSPTENPSGVWDTDYIGVWHLAEEGTGTRYDSTKNNNDGTPTNYDGDEAVVGWIGGADKFDGINDYITTSNGNSIKGQTQVTVEAWFNMAYHDGNSQKIYAETRNTDGSIRLEVTISAGSDLGFGGRAPDTDLYTAWVSGLSVNTDNWYHFVAVFDSISDTHHIYLNGVDYSNSVSEPAFDNTDPAGIPKIGALTEAASSKMNGTIDELRLSYGARSADWVQTEYNNQNTTSTFYNIGNEEIISINWLYRKPITVNSSRVIADLTDYPMLINIFDSDLKNKARSDGNDIIFTESDGRTRLDHEIESYDSNSGELIAWVRIPILSSYSDTLLYMYYGNNAVTSPTENPTEIWDTNYTGVWHLNDDLLDSTSNNQDGINGGSTNALGKFANGQEFDNTNYVYVPNFSSTIVNSTLTLSGWVNASTPDGSHDGYFGIRNGEDADFYVLRRSSGTELEFRFRNSTGSSSTLVPFPQAISNEWHYLSFVYDGNDVRAYINGIQEGGIVSSSGYIINESVDLFIGNDSRNNRLIGIIDEVRFSNTARSAAWIETEFNNQNDTSSFYTVGDEESFPQNWLYRKAITINASKITGDITNFPVLINTIDPDLKNKARADGYDILFTEEDGRTRLDHEVENYNSSTGELVAWVKVPYISSSADTTIYMHYGNSYQNFPTENPEGVWDDNYNAIWHLSEIALGIPGDYKDSTSNSYDGEGGSGTPWRIPARTTGKIGYGQNFDGINDIINCSSMNPMVYNDFTFEAWYKSSDNVPEKDEYIFAHRITNPNGPGVVFSVTDDVGEEGHLRLYIYNMTADFEAYYGTTNLTDMEFHHFVGVRENGIIRLYVDGILENVLLDQHPKETIIVNSLNSPTIGDFPSSAEEVNGTLDEIRVSRVARSWDWINASYSNQNDISTFYLIGPEEINLNSWLYRKPITISSSQVVEDLNDFPVLISIIDSDLKSKALNSGYDIVFTESDGRTKLDHEIERYNSSLGELIAWLKIPFLSSTSDTVIYMYYGNPNALDQQNIEGVWSNGFVGVYHMIEETGNINNSASSTNDGTRFDTPTRTSGQIGYAQEFTGSGADDYFNIGDLGIADGVNENLTISVWANIDNSATEDWGKIVSKRNETDDASTYRLQMTNDPDKRLSLELNAVSSDDCDIAKDTWVYITATYNGSERNLFINETQVYNGALSGSLWGSSKNVYIGVRKKESSVPDYKFGGILDEVRLSKAVRSASWIATEFNNQNDTSTFYTLDSEEQNGERWADNYNDVIVGAYSYGSDQGRAYIFFGGPGFAGEISAGNANVIINGTAPNGRLGWDVSCAGDVNNDGYKDMIVGSPGNNSNTGAVYIFFGDNFMSSLINDSDANVTIFGDSLGDEFGYSVSVADDVNDDGYDDVIVGAPGDNSDTGAAFIFFGNESMSSLISATNANVIMAGESTGDKLGYSVYGIGDIDEDGVSDVVVGAPYCDDGAKTDAGAVYIFEGGPSIDSTPDWSCKGERANDHFGWSVSFAHNLNDDGLTYLLVGAPNNDNGGAEAGKAYILTMIANKPLITNVLAMPSISNIGDYVNITCDVTALSGVGMVWVNITLPGGKYTNVSMIQGISDQWFYNDNYTIPGWYQYIIWANDTFGNWTKSSIHQFQVVNNLPSLSFPQVNPLAGNTYTGFNFTVIYTDLDNHAPNNIMVNITGISVYGLVELNHLDFNYTDGKEYYINLSGFSIGPHSFHFAANDSIGDWAESNTLLFDIFGNAPLLSFGQVDPSIGDMDTWFNFTVVYVHLDNLAPDIICLNITGVGIYAPNEVDPLDIDYSDGKDYYYNLTGFDIGQYSFNFAASDSIGNWNESGILQFEVINRGPTLSFGQVTPGNGYIDTEFNFTVTYTDLDNHIPGTVTLNVTGIGVYSLLEIDSLDTDFTDSKDYYLNLSGFALGTYSFHFATNDSFGIWTETGGFQFDVINRAPMLTLEQVDPIIGYVDTWYNFTVRYTDLDNHLPNTITVNISAMGVYDLLEVDIFDTDYTDGKEYNINLSGFSIGSYSFHLAANDTVGNWIETGVLQFYIINRDPVLSNALVNPTMGYIDTWFNFTVIYTDLDNHAPTSIMVNITSRGVYDLLEVNPFDTNHVDGKEYYLNISEFDVGQYSLHFAVEDIIGYWDESSVLQFTVLNRAPTLTMENVTPIIGTYGSVFNFTVRYTDLDNHGPGGITLNITALGIIDMFETNISDTNYVDSKEYHYAIILNAGSYSFHFAANDSLGMWAPETPEINAPEVLPKHCSLYAIDSIEIYGNDIQLNARLLDDDFNPIQGESVAFYIDINKNGNYEAGELIDEDTTLSDGSIFVIFTTHLAVETYDFVVIYTGSRNYIVEDDEAILTINPKAATLTANINVVEVGETTTLNATLIDDNGDPIENEQIIFYLDKNKNGIYEGSEFIVSTTTSTEGVASINYYVNLTPEHYGFWAKYAGSGNYYVLEIQGLLTVRDTGNKPPVILWTVPNQIRPEDSPPWTLNLSSYEADVEDYGPDLKWFMTGVDTSIYSVTGMNSSNDVLRFIPVENAFGNDEVVLWLVDSSGAVASQTLWINITPVNDLPYFSPLPPDLYVHYDDPSTNEDDPVPWDYKFYVHDVETPIENLILTTSEPLVDSGRGYAEVFGLKIAYHYPHSRIGESILISLRLSDGTDTTQTMIKVNVTSNWVPELINKLPDIAIEENTTLYSVFDLDDYFIDKDMDSLFFSSGYFHITITINENNSVDITAQENWAGTEYVTFRARDPTGAIAEDTINVTVIPVNDGPTISGVPNLVVHFDYSYAFDLSPYIFDPDNTTAELLVWTSESTNYIWLQQYNNLGLIVNYPEFMNGTTIPVTIYISDGLKMAYQTINVSITENFPPELKYELPDIVFDEDTTLIRAFILGDYFFDMDSEVLYYTNGTRFINVTINNDLSVDFSAPENWFGSEIVTFRATDPVGALAEDKILVVVVPVNDAPTIRQIPRQDKKEGDQWILDLSQYIDDVDNDISELTVIVENIVGGEFVILVGNILVFHYPEGIKEDMITITISDGELEASRSFTVNLRSSESVAVSIWDLIPWGWVILITFFALGGAFAFYKKRSRYSVIEAFLIHKNGLPIAHVSREEKSELEEVVVSGMFTAVQDFINDTFSDHESEDDWKLDEMKFGEHKILIERSQNLYLAAIFEGYSGKLKNRLKKVLGDINEKYGTVFEDWDGDMEQLIGIKGIMVGLILKKAENKELEESPMGENNITEVKEETLYEALEEVEKDFLNIMCEEEVKIANEEGLEVVEIEVFDCPVCGKEIEGRLDKCPRCGVEFVDIEDMGSHNP